MSASPAVPHVVTARSLRDIVALVPFACGFHPERSLVVVSLRGPRLRVGLVARVDLPPPDELDSGVIDDVLEVDALLDVVDDLARAVARDGGQASLLLVYDDQPWDADVPPHERLVTYAGAVLAASGAPARDVLYVSPRSYWSYLCRRPTCCPPEGRPVAEAMASPVGAALVVAGVAPLASRDELAARVQPGDPERVAEVVRLAWQRLERAAPRRAAGGLNAAVTAVATLLESLLERRKQGSRAIAADEAATVVAHLQDVGVRDEVLVRYCRRGMPGLDPPSGAPPRETDDEDLVSDVLVDLCTSVAGPLAAAPLTLLGWHSWARGDGAVARIAVDRALAEDPAYRLARLLGAALDHAVPPDWVEAGRRADGEAS